METLNGGNHGNRDPLCQKIYRGKRDYNTLQTEHISLTGILASQLWRRLHTLLYTITTETLTFAYAILRLPAWPRGIYTHTQYGIFTNIAITINNNNKNTLLIK